MQSLAFSPQSHRMCTSSPESASAFTFSMSVPRGTISVKCLSLSSATLGSSADDAVRFSEASTKGKPIPLHHCIFADQLTPVLAYRCLVEEDDLEGPSFLFESVEPVS